MSYAVALRWIILIIYKCQQQQLLTALIPVPPPPTPTQSNYSSQLEPQFDALIQTYRHTAILLNSHSH